MCIYYMVVSVTQSFMLYTFLIYTNIYDESSTDIEH